MKAVFCTKPFKQIIPVLINSSHKIICHSNIKSSVFLIGDNINIHSFHKENIFHLNIAVKFHLFLLVVFYFVSFTFCFPSLPTCLSHHPPASVIIRLPQSSSACLGHHPPASVIIRFNFLTVIIRHSFSLSLSGLTG